MPRALPALEKTFPTSIEYHPPLVISVHGAGPQGKWQEILASAMGDSPTKMEPFEYGTYGLWRFLTPAFGGGMIDRFYKWISLLIKSCSAVELASGGRRPSVVADSLGSWIVGNAMLKHADLRFATLILAGSILPRDFDWKLLFARGQVAFVRNECGQKDPWPSWARRVIARTGTGGGEGFKWSDTAVENVPCEWFGHSEAFLRQHIETHWIPVLRQRRVPFVLLHGRDIDNRDRLAKILGHAGTVIDTEAYGNLPNYRQVEIPPSLPFRWTRINPDIYTFLIDCETGYPVGYANTMPLDDTAYDGVRSGKLADNEILKYNVTPYVSKRSIKVYLMSVAVLEHYRRRGKGTPDGVYERLLTGFFDKLIWYAKRHNVRASHFLATAWTPEGHRICRHFGMSEVGKDRFGGSIFEVDLNALQGIPIRKVPPTLRRLIKVYAELKS
jgi:hypothetical protein